MPDGKVLCPGVITHASNIVEHPELIAERIMRFAKLVGRENVMAGADCGFSSQALYRTEVHATVVWEKFKAMRQGADYRHQAALEVNDTLRAPSKTERSHSQGGSHDQATLVGSAACRLRDVYPLDRAETNIKIGFVATSPARQRPLATIMRDAFELALDHLGRKMGGLDVEVIYEDDGLKPERQAEDGKADPVRQGRYRDRLYQFGVLLASLKTAVDAEKFPHQPQCRPLADRGRAVLAWFFSPRGRAIRCRRRSENT